MPDSIRQTVRSGAVATALFLVHTNLLIALAATSVALSTILFADLAVDIVPLFIVFAVTLFVYTFNRLTDLAEDVQNVPNRASFVQRYGTWLFVIGTLLYLAATVVAVLQGIPGAPAMAVPLIVAVLYSVVGLKRVLLVKNLLVGLSWGLIVLGVGVYYDVLCTIDILFLFGFVTTALTIAAVVFDIKDIEGDEREGIRTIPVVLGARRTRHVAIVSTVLLGGVVSALLATGLLDRQYALLVPFLGYMIGYSLTARRDRTPLFYGFVIDSEHIVLAVMLVAWELLA